MAGEGLGMASNQAIDVVGAIFDGPVWRRRPPMVWRREFRGVREQAHDARAFVRFLLADFADVDDVVQVAGELVANALTHTRSGAAGGIYVLELRAGLAGSHWPSPIRAVRPSRESVTASPPSMASVCSPSTRWRRGGTGAAPNGAVRSPRSSAGDRHDRVGSAAEGGVTALS
jgi:hypothetical protein